MCTSSGVVLLCYILASFFGKSFFLSNLILESQAWTLSYSTLAMRYVQECFHGPGGRTHRCHDWLNGGKDCWILHFVPTRVTRSCLQWTCGAVACGCLLATSYTGAVALTFQIGTLLVLMWCRSWNLPLDSNFRPCPLSLNFFLISQAESLPCSIALGFGFYPHITVAQNSISVNTP